MTTPTTDPPSRRWFITATGVEFAMCPIASVALAIIVTLARGFGGALNGTVVATAWGGSAFVAVLWSVLCLRRGETRPVDGMWLREEGDE